VTVFRTGFEGTAGVAIPTTGSSGTGGDAFPTGANGTGTAVVYANTIAAAVADGATYARFTSGNTGATVWRGWTFPAAVSSPAVRAYLYRSAHPAARLDFFQLLNLNPTANICRLAISTTGQLQILNNSTVVASSTALIPLNALVRIEADWTLATSGGSVRADWYLGHSTTPSGSITATGLAFTAASITAIRIGSPTTAIANLDFATDGWGVSDTGRLGPAVATAATIAVKGALSTTRASRPALTQQHAPLIVRGAQAAARATRPVLAQAAPATTRSVRSATRATRPQLTQTTAPTDPYGQLVNSHAPSMWYRLDGTTVDQVTGGNAGTLQGGAGYTTSLLPNHPAGQAADFDGLDDYLAVPHQAGLLAAAAFSMEAWVSWDALPNGRALIFDGDAFASRYGIDIGFLAEPSLYVWNGSSHTRISAPKGITAGGRHHVVGVKDGGTLLLYVDGVQVTSGPFSGPVPGASGGGRIGGDAGGSRLDGRVDEVAFYQRALTGTEIAAHYATGLGSSTLAVKGARVTTRATRPTAAQIGALVTRGARALARATRPRLDQAGTVTVRVARAVARVSRPALAQASALAVKGARSATRTTRLTLAQTNALQVRGARAAARSTRPTLAQTTALATNTARSGSRAGRALLVQVGALGTFAIRAPSRTGQPALTQAASLGVLGTRVATRARVVELAAPGQTVVHDARARTTASSPQLTQTTAIQVDGARAASRARAVTVAHMAALLVRPARAATRTTGLIVAQVSALTVRPARAASRTRAVTLKRGAVFVVRATRAPTRATVTVLDQLQLLTVAGPRAPTRARRALLVEGVPSETPPSRTTLVPADQRHTSIPAAPRVLAVPPDDRATAIPADPRTTAVPADDRTAIR